MNWLLVRHEARRRVREAHIGELERSVGFEPSVSPNGLPRIVVMRDPSGEWLMGDRWRTFGFSRVSDMSGRQTGLPYFGADEVSSATKRGCLRKARRRMRALVESDLTGPTEVTL